MTVARLHQTGPASCLERVVDSQPLAWPLISADRRAAAAKLAHLRRVHHLGAVSFVPVFSSCSRQVYQMRRYPVRAPLFPWFLSVAPLCLGHSCSYKRHESTLPTLLCHSDMVQPWPVPGCDIDPVARSEHLNTCGCPQSALSLRATCNYIVHIRTRARFKSH
jgi:hypothetical protein